MTERRMVTTGEGARLLDVPADWISKQRHRRKITPVSLLRGRGRGGAPPVYWLDELEELAADYHARRRGDTPKRGQK